MEIICFQIINQNPILTINWTSAAKINNQIEAILNQTFPSVDLKQT